MDDMDELMELYGSEDDINAARQEKDEAGEGPEDVGVLVKDYPAVQREIDLHGMVGAEAMLELERFIGRCLNDRILTVRVITGKGMHSPNYKSVLPELTEKRLAQYRRSGQILAFRRDKTGGAFLVYLVA